jgi:hypothetical protein
MSRWTSRLTRRRRRRSTRRKEKGVSCTSNGEGDLDLLLPRISFMLAMYSAVGRCTKQKKRSKAQLPTRDYAIFPGCSDGAVWVLASHRDISETNKGGLLKKTDCSVGSLMWSELNSRFEILRKALKCVQRQ